MTKEMSSAHGMTGMHHIMKMACDKMSVGTCQSSQPTVPGTVEHTFGRLYNAAHALPSAELLQKVADQMAEDPATAQDGPAEAGMAFFGQFIDHDLTLEVTSDLGQTFDGQVESIQNFRTPRLDLDCVYGSGREVTPHFYHEADENDPSKAGKMIFGRVAGEGDDTANPLDLQRNREGRALIGDPRNDENLFVSQVQGRMFVQQHNHHADSAEGDAEHRYEEGRKTMRAEYHRMIVRDFLPQIIHESVLGPLMNNANDAAARNQKFLNPFANITWQLAPDMPVEFSAAAYRFGHSMIRETYKLNDKPGRENVPIFAQADDADAIDLRGFSPVHEDNNLDMDLFFGPNAQRASPIDTHLPTALLNLPPEIVPSKPNLAFRNMERGQITFALPSGEVVAGNMGYDTIDADPKLGHLIGNTPLWFYILSEAEQNGGKLGNVGGSLVGGVLLNLMLRGESPYFFPEHNGSLS